MHDVERAISRLQNAAQGIHLALYRTDIHTLINAAQAYKRMNGQLELKNKELVQETHRWSAAVKQLEAERAGGYIPTSDTTRLPPPGRKVVLVYGPEDEDYEGHQEIGYRVVADNGKWWWSGFEGAIDPSLISHFLYLPAQLPTTDEREI